MIRNKIEWAGHAARMRKEILGFGVET